MRKRGPPERTAPTSSPGRQSRTSRTEWGVMSGVWPPRRDNPEHIGLGLAATDFERSGDATGHERGGDVPRLRVDRPRREAPEALRPAGRRPDDPGALPWALLPQGPPADDEPRGVLSGAQGGYTKLVTISTDNLIQ